MSNRYVVAATFDSAKKYAESQYWSNWTYVTDPTVIANLGNDEIHLTSDAVQNKNFTAIANTIINQAPDTNSMSTLAAVLLTAPAPVATQGSSPTAAKADTTPTPPAPTPTVVANKPAAVPAQTQPLPKSQVIVQTSKIKVVKNQNGK